MEPWYELLAIPAAPFLLAAQLLAAELPARPARHAVAGLCSGLLAALCVLAWTTTPADGAADVGGVVLGVALVASLGLLGAQGREAAPSTRPPQP